MTVRNRETTIAVLGPNGEVDLPDHILVHLGIAGRAKLRVRKGANRTLLMRRMGPKQT